jgi:general nucleoside transport system permease protein
VKAFLGIIPIILGYSTPLVLAGLGGLFSERSGVVNIALEGIMMIGGFAAATVTVLLEPFTQAAAWIGLLSGLLAGTLYSLLHAFASVNLRANQVVSGTALNILAAGLTVFLCQIIFRQQRTASFSSGLIKIDVPFLSALPLIGPAFFKNVYPTFYIAVALVLLSWFVLQKTALGLRLRSCGEHPQAAASLGISVAGMRYAGVLASGALAGLAGATMVLSSDIQYSVVSIHGSGFIALACLIFGAWNPFGVLGAALFFGASQVLSLYAKDIPFLSRTPTEAFNILPYALTIVALIVFSGRGRAGPKAAGEIYDPGKR